jgi:site-specific recombinase XerD
MWFSDCWKRNLARESVRSYHRALSRFWRWCAIEYDVKNPMRNIKRPRKAKKKPKIVTAEDWRKMFDAACSSSNPERDRFLLALLLDSGARRGAVEWLTLNRLDLTRFRADVIKKGSRPDDTAPEDIEYYTIHFTAPVARLGRKWLSVRPMTDNNYVFVSERQPHTRLTGSGIRQIVRRLKVAADVTGRATPHSFRHSFATWYLLNGGDLHSLCALAGWSDMRMAKEYITLTDKQKADLQRKNSPLARALAAET